MRMDQDTLEALSAGASDVEGFTTLESTLRSLTSLTGWKLTPLLFRPPPCLRLPLPLQCLPPLGLPLSLPLLPLLCLRRLPLKNRLPLNNGLPLKNGLPPKYGLPLKNRLPLRN